MRDWNTSMLQNLITDRPFGSFFPQKVVACFSDRSVDFRPRNDVFFGQPAQTEYVRQRTGCRRIALVRQVHGHAIKIVDANNGFQEPPIEADGILTDCPNLPIGIRTADCLSIFLHDPRRNVIGLLHAGWRSTYQQISNNAVCLMKERWGSSPDDIRCAFGPCISTGCYEVSEDFRDHFPLDTREHNGRLYCDLIGANRRQLHAAGINKENIISQDLCTFSDPRFFSHRREGEATGRMLSLMMLHEI